jgi:signal transduction histidine kinase
MARILLDLGQLCLRARDVTTLVQTVLGHLILGTGAAAGWIAMPDPRKGVRCHPGPGVNDTEAATLLVGLAFAQGAGTHEAAPVGPPLTDALPGQARGGHGIAMRLLGLGGPQDGWLLLVGPSGRRLAPEADVLVEPAVAFLALAYARLKAAADLKSTNQFLQRTVDEQTAELRREKESLEERVRERTYELEEAKRATLHAERLLLDRERREGVHQVAAGIAHALNNPLGALRANLQFIAEEIEEGLGDAVPEATREDLRGAIADATADADRIAGSIESLFGEAAAERRAAVRTSVVEAVAEAERTLARLYPDAVRISVEADAGGVHAGVAGGELLRWVLRLLEHAVGASAGQVAVRVTRDADGPVVRIHGVEIGDVAGQATLDALREEVERAGGRLGGTLAEDGLALALHLPAPHGERGAFARQAS